MTTPRGIFIPHSSMLENIWGTSRYFAVLAATAAFCFTLTFYMRGEYEYAATECNYTNPRIVAGAIVDGYVEVELTLVREQARNTVKTRMLAAKAPYINTIISGPCYATARSNGRIILPEPTLVLKRVYKTPRSRVFLRDVLFAAAAALVAFPATAAAICSILVLSAA